MQIFMLNNLTKRAFLATKHENTSLKIILLHTKIKSKYEASNSAASLRSVLKILSNILVLHNTMQLRSELPTKSMMM